MGLFWIVYAIHMSGPTLITRPDKFDDFLGVNAVNHLEALTDLGPRVVGSRVNEELTVDLLQNIINDIIKKKHPGQDVEMKLQKQSGNFYLDYKPFGSYMVYESLQNIMVRIKSDDEATSILVNSHFDTVPGSPGGSDDGIMVAVMLETLRVMSTLPEKPKNDVIFLFNGAEEAALLASHAFIKYHEWASSCKFLVNLEATGAGGKEILFQTGPGNAWLLEYYADTPHPHGQAAGEELFQSGIIPSDTDFRIFRDFGDLIGFDFAFYQDGYRYHTPYDGFKNIDEKWFQHTGDNTLHLVRKLAYDKELLQKRLDNDDSSQKAVYFDFIGSFFVHYGKGAELAINIVTCLASIASFGLSFYKIPLGLKSKSKYTAVALGMILLGWITGETINITIGSILDAASRTMTWYASNALIFSLYCLPAICCVFLSVTAIKFYTGRKWEEYEDFTDLMQAEYLCHLHRMIWTIVLICLTAAGIRSGYVFVPYILFTTVGFIISQCLIALNPNKLELIWIPIYIVALIMPSMFTAYFSAIIFQLLLPIMGRFGDGVNPEIIIGGMATFLTIVYTCSCAPFMILSKNQKYFYMAAGVIYVIFLIVLATPAAFPYSECLDNPKPQRYWIFHSKRTFRDDNNNVLKTDAGFTFNVFDRNSPFIIENDVPEIRDRISLKTDCDNFIFCGLPTTNSRNLKDIEDTIWVPTSESPIFPSETKLTLKNKVLVETNVYKYTFELEGPDRINLYVSPRRGIDLLSLSLADQTITEGVGWKNQKVYNILYTSGVNPIVPFMFDLTVKDSNEMPLQKMLDIAIVGKYVHNELNQNTPAFNVFLWKFPKWTTQTP